ncbi:uncharacterized protein LOC133301773 [Gastrolobium bilobum]|uniref:uncharacterized protein LOC133286557 n=1 Tax=Gastrolobium bilobum TaxID=150636 RepID=UPI002AB104FE|nr:uncharacterized protein LOC133286557 [Gastrolobium bilobum]XP_061357452.1 uncharacterized protein LOC133301773 [Gastrolobium bilobum]
MYTIGHKKKDGSFVSEEARSKNDELLEEIEDASDEDEAFEIVFGKEHSGRVRGMGFGVVPSQMRKRKACAESSSNSVPSQAEYNSLKEEHNSLKEELVTLKGQMAAIIQLMGGTLPPNLDADMGSPGIRRSSNASHNPAGGSSPIVPPQP